MRNNQAAFCKWNLRRWALAHKVETWRNDKLECLLRKSFQTDLEIIKNKQAR